VTSSVGIASLSPIQARLPPPGPEDTYLGLTATVYHVVGLYAGAVLMLLSALALTAGSTSGDQTQVVRPTGRRCRRTPRQGIGGVAEVC